VDGDSSTHGGSKEYISFVGNSQERRPFGALRFRLRWVLEK
jgi:hypothetical protein